MTDTKIFLLQLGSHKGPLDQSCTDIRPTLPASSVKADECQLTGIPAVVINGIFEKAQRLLSDSRSIIPAPSDTPNSFCVRSESNKSLILFTSWKVGTLSVRIVRSGSVLSYVPILWQ